MAKINLGLSSANAAAQAPAQAAPLVGGFPASPQQLAIFNFMAKPGGNLIVEARAGTGKTTTLIQLCKQFQGRGSVIFLAFNKAIATEIGRKLADEGLSWKEAKASTMHAVGFQAWVKHAPRSRSNVRGEKLDILMESLGTPTLYRSFCKRLVSLAKQNLIGVDIGPESAEIDDTAAWLAIVEHYDLLQEIPQGDEEIDEETYLEYALAWGLKLLRESIRVAAEMIDFDDMIYMPLYSRLRFWRYDLVLIDEAQDTNIARRVLADRLLRPGGRLVAVGDRHQAIYGFTGASADALDLIQEDFQCELLPLTVTYRCPRRVVEMAQRWVPDIEARPDAPEGLVTELTFEQFAKLTPEPTDAIICRNTKPIVQLAFSYLRRHIPCFIEGREIGASLITLCRKWKSAVTIRELRERLEEFLERERERLLAQFKEAQFHAAQDKVETLLVLCDSLGEDQLKEDLIELLQRMFKDAEGMTRQVLTLSTVHKAKGREWPRVYFLGRRALIPSAYAKLGWQLEQESNLAYVGVTRAQEELIEVLLPARRS